MRTTTDPEKTNPVIPAGRLYRIPMRGDFDFHTSAVVFSPPIRDTAVYTPHNLQRYTSG